MSKVKETIEKYNKTNLYGMPLVEFFSELGSDLKEIQSEQEELQKKADAYDEHAESYASLIESYEQLQEQNKPVEVPQFVADWFEKNKEDLDYRIWVYIYDFNGHGSDDFNKWMNGSKNKPIETLICMQNGYTVKQEQEQEAVKKETVGINLEDYVNEDNIVLKEQSKPIEVPPEFEKWYSGIKEKCNNDDKTARYYALMSLCRQMFGKGYNDYDSDRTWINYNSNLGIWFSQNKENAIEAIYTGNYIVKQEKEWIVDIGGMYLKEPLGDTSDYTIKMTWERAYAYKFSDWNIAREHTSTLGGRIILSTEEQR